MIVAKRILQTNLEKDQILKVLMDCSDFSVSIERVIVRLSTSNYSFFNPKVDLQFKTTSDYTFVDMESRTSVNEVLLLIFTNLINLIIIVGNLFNIQIIPGLQDFDYNVWMHLGFLFLFNLILIIGSWYHKKESLGAVQALIHTNSSFIKSSELFWGLDEFGFRKKA